MLLEEKMKITVSEIEDEGLRVSFNEPIEGNSLARPMGDVKAEFFLTRKASELNISGSISGRVCLQCSRCLIEFQRDLELSVDLTYLPIEEMSTEEIHEIGRDESEIGYYKDDEIDITDVVKEQLLLNLPMKPLCSDECKGLCPVCGTDLNLQSCNCKKDEIDPRLSILKKLLSSRKEN